MSPDERSALARLHEGNRRFVEGKTARDPARWEARRRETAAGQKPFAAVLGCADSRVPPELVFDADLGELFVVRAAGQVCDPVILGSLEFAVEVLGVPLVLVLGHEGCGAVQAALSAGERPPGGHLAALVEAIGPSLAALPPPRTDEDPAARIAAAVRAHVARTVERLPKESEVLRRAVREDRIAIVGGVYDLATGRVAFSK